jgi:sugar lactone lactonase YvrE
MSPMPRIDSARIDSARSARRSLARLGYRTCLVLALAACRQTEPTGAAPKPAASATQSEQKALGSSEAPPGTSAPTSAGPSGSVRVLLANAEALQRPTTAAFRGQTLFVSIGQLSALFSDGGQPRLPFGAIALRYPSGELGTEKVALPGADYYPEGITAAPDGTLYIGSIMQGVILKAPAGSTNAEAFVKKGVAKRGVLGVTVDSPRQLLWFCDSNPKLEDSKKAGDLVGVKLADGKEVVRHSLPSLDGKPPFCNDVIVSPDGGLWFTESAGGRVFNVPAAAALQPNSAQAWLTGGEVGPPPSGGSGANGLEWMDGKLIVANVGRGTLVELDPSSPDPRRAARVINLVDAETRAPVSLCSPDGLERPPGTSNKLVVIENGGCAAKTPRVSEVTLDTSG